MEMEVKVVQEAKKIARSNQKLEKTRRDPPLKPSEGAWHSNILVLDFWSQKSERIYSCCFKAPCLWWFVMEATGNS